MVGAELPRRDAASEASVTVMVKLGTCIKVRQADRARVQNETIEQQRRASLSQPPKLYELQGATICRI